MKGFIRKELYVMDSVYRKNLLLMCGVYAVIAVSMNMIIFSYMMIWVAAFYSLGNITLDEQCGWNEYLRMLPVSNSSAVGAKFLAAALMVGLASVYSLALGLVTIRVHGGSLAELLYSMALIICIVMLQIGIMLPCGYRWGAEKTRTAMLMGYAALFAGIFLFKDALAKVITVSTFTENQYLLLIILFVVAIIANIVGYFAAKRITR